MYKKQTIDNKNGNILSNVYTGIVVGPTYLFRVFLLGVTALINLLATPLKVDGGFSCWELGDRDTRVVGVNACVCAIGDPGADIIN